MSAANLEFRSEGEDRIFILFEDIEQTFDVGSETDIEVRQEVSSMEPCRGKDLLAQQRRFGASLWALLESHLEDAGDCGASNREVRAPRLY